VNLFTQLFIPTKSTFSTVGQFMNLGPAFLLLAIPGVVGLAHLLKQPRTRVFAFFLSVSSLFVIASAMTAETVNLRTFFGWSLGRFLLVPAVASALFAASSEFRSRRNWLWIALTINIVLAVPLGWSDSDRIAIVLASKAALPAAAVGVTVTLLLARRRWAAAAAATGGATAIATIALCLPIRESLRYRYFADLSSGTAYSVNKDASQLAKYWPVWRALDQPTSLRLAVTGDWGTMSPLGPRYPLLGSRLQNSLDYVPITTSGDVIDRPEFYANMGAGDYDAWSRRLIDQRIDYLFVLTEPAIEAGWAKSHPEVFSPQNTDVPSAGLLYRLNNSSGTKR
jgi:hypothetical protein